MEEVDFMEEKIYIVNSILGFILLFYVFATFLITTLNGDKSTGSKLKKSIVFLLFMVVASCPGIIIGRFINNAEIVSAINFLSVSIACTYLILYSKKKSKTKE